MRFWVWIWAAGCGGLQLMAGDEGDIRGDTAALDADTDTDADADSDTDADSDMDTDSDSDTDTDTDTDPPQVAVSPPAPLPAGVLSALQADIDQILGSVNYTHGAYVMDLDNGQEIYSSNPDRRLRPASNTKLFTTGAALDLLGEDHQFEVSVWSDAPIDANGRVDDLDILSEHDATWSDYVYNDQNYAAERIADLLWEAGLRRILGVVTLHGEVLVDGESLGGYSAYNHRQAGIGVLRDALESRGISIEGGTTTSSNFSHMSTPLVSRRSAPLSTVTYPINVYSHNEMADILSRHNGYELQSGSDYIEGEAAVLDWISGLGINPGPLNFEDGSGLSLDNRVTARIIVDMQRAMYARPAGEAWRESFSIGGVNGTLAHRLTGADTDGRVFGKTGTVWQTIATSGFLVNRHDGHRYLFSLLMNDVSSESTARDVQDEVIEALALDHRPGARPDAPTLKWVRNRADGTLEVAWTSAHGASDYAVWVSDDGVWDRTDAWSTTATSLVIHGLTNNRGYDVRVVARNSAGLSNPSDTYRATSANAASVVLVVDGDDRYDNPADQWENTLGTGQAFAAVTGAAIAGRPFDTVANEEVIAGTVDLWDYDAVVWVLGEESSTDLTFDGPERASVATYLAGGGNLLVSGAEIGWDLDYLGSGAMIAFYNDTLKASFVEDDAGTYSALPVPGGLFDGVGELGFYTPGTMQVSYPDRITTSGGSQRELVYLDGTGGTAAVSYSGAYRLVHLAFPFETIDNAHQRGEIMERTLSFFGL